MVYGQMNEPPGNRLRVALSGLTMAEYFRDEIQPNGKGRDVLFFVDNIYRYTLAGTEVSALLGRMPRFRRRGRGRPQPEYRGCAQAGARRRRGSHSS